MSDNNTSDDLAARFVERCAKSWMDRELPVELLAAAMVAWGLNVSTHTHGPMETAAGLGRIAEGILDQAAELDGAG